MLYIIFYSVHVETNLHRVVSFSLQRLRRPLVSACLFLPAAPRSGCCRRPATEPAVSKTGRKLLTLRSRLAVSHLLAAHGAHLSRQVVDCGRSGGGATAGGHDRQVHVAARAVHPGTGLRGELGLLRVDAADGGGREGNPPEREETPG